jgi:hypothetical protein
MSTHTRTLCDWNTCLFTPLSLNWKMQIAERARSEPTQVIETTRHEDCQFS